MRSRTESADSFKHKTSKMQTKRKLIPFRSKKKIKITISKILVAVSS